MFVHVVLHLCFRKHSSFVLSTFFSVQNSESPTLDNGNLHDCDFSCDNVWVWEMSLEIKSWHLPLTSCSVGKLSFFGDCLLKQRFLETLSLEESFLVVNNENPCPYNIEKMCAFLLMLRSNWFLELWTMMPMSEWVNALTRVNRVWHHKRKTKLMTFSYPVM